VFLRVCRGFAVALVQFQMRVARPFQGRVYIKIENALMPQNVVSGEQLLSAFVQQDPQRVRAERGPIRQE
jgi:hypothetical protein